MKKTVVLKVNEKTTYDLGYNLKQLSRAERMLGRSIISIFAGNLEEILSKATLDFTSIMLMAGLDVSEDRAFEIINEFCVDNSIDELNGIIINAIMQTGLFTKAAKAQTPEPQPVTAEEQPAEEQTKKTKKKAK